MSVAAPKAFEVLSEQKNDPVTIRGMNGREIDPALLRPSPDD
jgi:hypothetical protein